MARVYISSTFSDLEEYRERVYRTLRALRHDVIAMEDYAACDERPLDRCLADLASCDVYVGIVAHRYGYVPTEGNPDGRSITELEYHKAGEVKIPRLIFLLDSTAAWPPAAIDAVTGDGKDGACIRALREKFTREYVVSFFTTPEELAGRVGIAMSNRMTSEAADAASTDQLAADTMHRYYNRMRQRYARLDLDALTPPQREEYLQIQLRSVFVGQDIREDAPPVELPRRMMERLGDRGEVPGLAGERLGGLGEEELEEARASYERKPRRSVLDVLAEAGNQRLVILGDPGSGKSTLARYVVLSLTEGGTEPKLATLTGYLPVLIELREYGGACEQRRCDNFLAFLTYLERTEGSGLDGEQLQKYLKRGGKAVVVFDGLDELFDPGEREAVSRQIAGFATRFPDTRVVVTSRLISYQRAVLAGADFRHFTLQDLDGDAIDQFIRSWYELALHDRPEDAEHRRERLRRAIRQSDSIAELAGNPMLLTILAIIGKHQELPRERWQVYEHAAEVLVQHWDVNKHLASARPGADFLDAEDKKELLRRVALSMQQAEEGLAGNHVHREELQQEFEGYLTTRYGQDAATAKATAKAMIEQFRERNFVLSRYGAGLYGFVHRALLEYFCADALVRRFEKQKQLTLDELKTEVFDRYWSDESWHEVLRLISSMLDERFSGEIIQSLIDKVPPPWPVTLKNKPFRNVTLAAQCLAEARNVAAFAEQTTALLRRVVELIEHAARTWELGRSDFRKQVLEPVVEVVNPRWVGREHMRDWFMTSGIRATVLHKEPWVGRLVGALFADSDAMQARLQELAVAGGHSRWRSAGLAGLFQGWRTDDGQSLALIKERLIGDRDTGPRILAAELIADGWPGDPEVLDLLRGRAAQDSYEDVREAVLPLVGRLSQDATTFAFLCERALRDGSWQARRAAIQAIGESWSGAPEALGFLRERAVRDDDTNVRGRAIYRIGRDFRHDSHTLAFLHDRVLHGVDAWDRASALQALGESFRDDPQGRPLLVDRLVNDLHPHIRRVAGEALAKQWVGDPDVFALLQERATHDPSHNNRARFITAIVDNWPDHPVTVSFLRARAEADLHHMVRSRSIRELTLVAHDDPGTQALLRRCSVDDASASVRAEALDCLAWAGLLRTTRFNCYSRLQSRMAMRSYARGFCGTLRTAGGTTPGRFPCFATGRSVMGIKMFARSLSV